MPDPNDVVYFFDLAIQQYADLNLFFYLDKCEYSHIKSMCVGIKKGHFITRTPLAQIAKTPIVWGTEVNGYFSVRDTRLETCHFRTNLARIYNAPPDSIFLVFPLPRVIDHNQRRFSMRVNLDEEVADKFGVWHGILEGGDDTALPALRWLGLDPRHCPLAELSANGMRLDFAEKSPMLEKMSINDEMLLRGNFGIPKKPVEIFALGNVVRIMPKLESEGMVSVGCHFRAWRKTDSPFSQAWFKADTEVGIGVIAQWLARNFKAVRS